MKEEFWEKPIAVLCNLWWVFLIIIVLAVVAYFTRDLWMPALGLF